MSHPTSTPAASTGPSVDILGTQLSLTTYEGLASRCLRLSADGVVFAVAFANVHWVTARRSEDAFRDLARVYDMIVPDGMPLVWMARAAGHRQAQRVYGPEFFRRFVQRSGARRHYLIGGSPFCGERLVEAVRSWNPQAEIVGRFHGRCADDGCMEGEDDVLADIDARRPDFIWVGLGTPKQDAWVRRYRSRLARGVVLSVGFAFDLNAGLKGDAPELLQRAGLGWAFRMASEPGRLLPRYLRYNALFAWYVASDLARGRLFRDDSNPRG